MGSTPKSLNGLERARACKTGVRLMRFKHDLTKTSFYAIVAAGALTFSSLGVAATGTGTTSGSTTSNTGANTSTTLSNSGQTGSSQGMTSNGMSNTRLSGPSGNRNSDLNNGAGPGPNSVHENGQRGQMSQKMNRNGMAANGMSSNTRSMNSMSGGNRGLNSNSELHSRNGVGDSHSHSGSLNQNTPLNGSSQSNGTANGTTTSGGGS
ncbi:MAG: hypothetical protein WBL23_10445 [Salinisphaera sp.]|uniref:hypothetical protein n=1 Tax=Salinisphaera sp. TaxID=1914330 RepID=UPI003C7E207D